MDKITPSQAVGRILRESYVMLPHPTNLFKLLPAYEAITIQVKLPESCLHPVNPWLQLSAELILLNPTAAQEAGLEDLFKDPFKE